MRNMLLVGLGGFVGSVLRYGFSGWLHRLFSTGLFPVGTLGVNIVGSFFIGLLGGLSDQVEFFDPQIRVFLLMGLLGGFTTFSTFSYETLAMFHDGQYLYAGLNLLLHLAAGLGAVALGYGLAA
jgi:CrcB protein